MNKCQDEANEWRLCLLLHTEDIPNSHRPLVFNAESLECPLDGDTTKRTLCTSDCVFRVFVDKYARSRV